MGSRTSRWLERSGLASDRGASGSPAPRVGRGRAFGLALLALSGAAAGFSACSDGGATTAAQSSATSGATTSTATATTTTTSGVGGSGGASGSSSSAATTGSGGAGGTAGPPLVPAAGGARRLIARQYLGSIRTLLGASAANAATPPIDQQLNGLETIGGTYLATAASSVQTYESSALAVASVVVSDPAILAAILPCTPSGPADSACLGQFVTTWGRLAWRRALTDAEVTRVTAAGMVAAKAYNSFDAGLGTTISALLQSPYFLYIIEIGAPDAADPTVRRLTPAELATRISFFLLNSTPDSKLLDAAEKGALDDDDGIRKAALDMLKRAEAKDTLEAFYSEIYRLRELGTVHKDPTLFPQFNDALKASMQEETLRLIDDVVWTRDADAREIISANYTFVDAHLAQLYGVPPPTGNGFSKVVLPAEQKRAGFLGHASFLTRGAHDKETSPTRRGSFILDALLCSPVDPPPPTVSTVLPDDGTPKPVKQKLLEHMQNASCSFCHARMDPVGFALENYDAIGQFRTTDQGFPVDSTGMTPELGSFSSAVDLAALVVDDPRSSECFVQKLYRESMGHLETTGEQPAVDDLVKAFSAKGHSIQSLLVELTASPAFRLVGDPK